MAANVTVSGLAETIKMLEAMDRNVSAVLREAALAGGEVVRKQAAANAPPGHGKDVIKEIASLTAESVTVKVGNQKDWWQAVFFEVGAKAHPITTDRKKVLANNKGEIFGTVVSHPGLSARPWLHPAYMAHKKEAQLVIQSYLKRAVMG